MRTLVLLVLSTSAVAVTFLGTPKAQVATNTSDKKIVVASVATGKSEVATLRAKLSKVAAGLFKLLDAKTGSLAGTKIAAGMKTFSKELSQTLKETEGKSDAASLKRLKDAQAGVHSLVRDMTSRQVNLMKETQEQARSLLLGVLMTRKDEPMEKQMEVLSDPEFKDLPEVKAILAAKDTKTPLFKQIAQYIDKHENRTSAASVEDGIPAKLKKLANGKPDVTPIVDALEVKIKDLEKSEKRRDELHAKEMKSLEDAAVKEDKKKNERLAKKVRRTEKKEDREFKKQQGLAHKDIGSLKAAVTAIEKGDLKALGKAQSALEQSLHAMSAHNGGFLVLIQMTHRLEGLDCPYCAAQCVDKCHTEGKSYVTCLTECADAGK